MKNINKIFVSTIVLTTMFSPISVLAATDKEAVVTAAPVDVLQQVKLLGLMQGDLNGEMRPNDTLTRAELATVLCKLLRLNVTTVLSSDFSDVSPSDWSAGAIHAVRQAGIMSGYGENFGPNDKITREQLALVLVRALGVDTYGKGELLPSDLKASTSAWAQDAVQTIRELGFMELNNNPQQALIRQEIATAVVKVVDRPAGDVRMGTGTITIGGITYEVSASLQGVLNADNALALKGSKLEFTRDGYKITGLKRLELNAADSVLDAKNTELTADVVINAKVTLKNVKATGTLTANGSALDVENATFTKVELAGSDFVFKAKGNSRVDTLLVGQKASLQTDGDAVVEKLQLGSNASTVEVKGHVKQLEINESTHAKITLSQGAKVDNVTVSGNAKLKDYFVNYDQVKYSLPLVNNAANPDLYVPGQSSNPQPNVEKTALNLKLTEAKALQDGTTVGSNAGQVPQAAMDALSSAITAAQVVAGNSSATQQQVDDAVSALTQAIQTFKNQILVAQVDKSALSAKVDAANALKGQHSVGTGDGQVPQAAWDAFTTAISAATAVLTNTQATQQDVNGAVDALTQAMTAFQSQIISVQVDKTALATKLQEANTLKVQHPVGTGNGQVPQAAWDAFTTAIDAATAMLINTQATQQDVNGAVDALTQAMTAFQSQIIVVEVDKTALAAKLTEANALRDQHTVGEGAGHVSQTAWNAFSTSIQAASNVYSDAQATQQQVNNALAALTQAIAEFEEAYMQALTISLAPDAQFPFNNSTSTMVTISDSYFESAPGTKYQYSKRNIKDLIKVKRGNQEEGFKYDSGANSFLIYDLTSAGTLDLSKKVGEVKVTATTSDINLSGNGTYGVYVNASNSSYTTTSATVDFELFENNNSDGKVSLPISLDRTPPIWTGGTWTSANGSNLAKITVSSNESIFVAGVFGSTSSVQVEYSQSGDFTDTVQVNQGSFGYSKYEAVGNELFIYMTQSWIDSMKQTKPPTATSKFRITMNGIYDFANNEAANRVVLLNVPSF